MRKRDHSRVNWMHLTASTFFGGPERQMLGLARQVSPGIQTLFASFSEGGRCRSFLDVCKQHDFSAIELSHDSPRFLRVLDELVDLIRTHRIDLLLTHTYKPNLLGRIAAYQAGIPHVIVSRGWTGESLKVRIYEFLDRINLRFADRVVAVSAGQAEKVRRCGVPTERRMIIRNAARLEDITSIPKVAKNPLQMILPGKRHIVLAAGRLSPEKGFDVLINAAKFSRESTGFVAFGDGVERSRLQKQIDDQGLSHRFLLPGFTSELDRLIPHADLFVLPSRTEGLPNVALEAAAAGRAIVATAVGGTPEIVRDGVNGLLVPSDDPTAMATAINRLTANETERRSFGEAGRGLVESEFSFSSQADSYRRLASDLLAPQTLPITRRRARRSTQRIAFVIDSLNRAGTESQLLALIRSLDRTRFIPELILLNGDDPMSQSLEPTDCEVVRLGVASLMSFSVLQATHALRTRWRTNRPDQVVAYFLDSAYLTLPIAKSLGISTVRVRNNLGYWFSAKHRLLGRLIQPLTDRVLTNSDDGRTALIDQDGYRPEQVTVIENGVDFDQFAAVPSIQSGTPLRVGCVANLRPVKNIDGLIRVAAMLPGVNFAIAGDGPIRADLQRQIDSLNLADRVRLLGSVSDIPEFFAKCTVVVLPSHSESLSNALLEAMAAGRAIIATDVGANRRVLGDSGMIIPPGDDRSLVNAIQKLCGHADHMAEMGRLASRRVREHFSRELMVRRFEAFLARSVEYDWKAKTA